MICQAGKPIVLVTYFWSIPCESSKGQNKFRNLLYETCFAHRKERH